MTVEAIHSPPTSGPAFGGAEPTPPVTILIVDDEPLELRLVGGLVEKAPGFKAIYAANGVEALAVIERQAPALVLTDLQMPEMDGLELVQEIRQRHATLPVVLMTAYGSEEIAIKALNQGAASYVPKSTLHRDLLETLEQVLDVARSDIHQMRLLECMIHLEAEFVLNNDRTLIPPLVAHLQQHLQQLNLGDPNSRMRVGVALEEALLNGIFHGNLEVSSELRQTDEKAFLRLAEERRQLAPYRDRHLYVSARMNRSEAVFVIRNEGPGFDPSTLPDPTDPANLEKACGRGLLLIRTFMDEVVHNSAGNLITMVKRAARRKTG